MTPQEYLEFTRTTAARSTSGISDEDWATYVRLGLISEVGEVAGQVKRIIRDDGGVLTDERREKLLDELGDVLWYWAQLCDANEIDIFNPYVSWSDIAGRTFKPCTLATMDLFVRLMADDPGYNIIGNVSRFAQILGSTLEEVAVRNVAKLSARVTAGTIHGEGDDR